MCIYGFSERLEDALTDKNVSRSELARKINVRPASVNNYIDGTTTPNATNLAKICKVLNVSSDWLLGLTNNKKER